ncbi:MAG: response regulator, partial [Candidatus Acidiferrales bacterium]
MGSHATFSHRILIVEDEENARKGYEALLRKWGCEILGVGSAEEGLAQFPDFQPAVILADVELPGMNGLDFLIQVHQTSPETPVIIITGRGSDERAVQAIEAGAFWYIEKPLKAPVLRSLLDRAMGKVRDLKQVAALTRQLRDAGRLGELVGASKSMAAVMRQVETAAPSTASVL